MEVENNSDANHILGIAPRFQNLHYTVNVLGRKISDKEREKLKDPTPQKPTYMLRPLTSVSIPSGGLISEPKLAQKLDYFTTKYSLLKTDIGSTWLKAQEQSRTELAEGIHSVVFNKFSVSEGLRRNMINLMGSVIRPDDPRVFNRAAEIASHKYSGRKIEIPQLELTSMEQRFLRGAMSDELTHGLVHIGFISEKDLKELTSEEIREYRPDASEEKFRRAEEKYREIRESGKEWLVFQRGMSFDIKTGIDKAYGPNDDRLVLDYQHLFIHSAFLGGVFRRSWESWSTSLLDLGMKTNKDKKGVYQQVWSKD